MIQGINATSSLSIQHQSTSRNATGTLSGVSSSGDDSQNSEQLHASDGGNYVVSSQGDTVSISQTGAKAAKTFTASSKNSISDSENGTASTSSTDGLAQTLSGAAGKVGITSSSAKTDSSSGVSGASGSSSSSTSSSSDLSGYSDAELQQMLQKGKITQAEYNAEISKRKQQEQQQNANSDASVTDKTSSTEQNNS